MKYIIELEDKPFISEHGEELYRAKGFKSLVFDQNGIDRLTQYTEPQDDKIRPGDEVECDTNKMVVISAEGGRLWGVNACGTFTGRKVGDWHKTGRRFPELLEILQKVGGTP